MKIRLLAALALMLALAAGRTPANAQAAIAFVSSSGNDSIACTSTQNLGSIGNCLSFTGALTSAGGLNGASGGVIQCAVPGVYQKGTFTISVAVTINCPGGYLAGNLVISASAGKVVIRGLTIDGVGASGDGITISDASAVELDGVTVAHWAGNGVNVAVGANLTVNDSTFNDNGGNGIVVQPASGTAIVSLTHIDAEGNGGAGVLLNGTGETQVNLTDSVVAHNNNGVDVEGSGSQRQFLTTRNDNLVMNNNDGLLANGGQAFVLFGTSTIAWNHNTGVAQTNGSLVFSYRSSEVNGNLGNDTAGTINTVGND